ncbi:MAG: NADH-quinone oxidoreductase subunit NuoN [Actinobacteria bacterium]|nr:NADH-quinone oxidoreductase subunit NuoN [Actinomycetota bacterium]NCX39235.1 NADH-quinone oxidoreductase subunit NuoN [Actinomycetota bacterium]NDA45103.1 NADH-quinone oxidoreductase subunit NuoN [Actinomycetota bacterium]NDF90114.1 NADH-quinone oxidoreductase subunit NuoN [Actinomycetota bacterium]
MEFSSPVLNYTLLSPMLILLGGAIIGVLVEAFMSKALRPITQLSVTIGSLILALVQVWRIRNDQSLTAAMGSVVIDGPAVLMQASILIISLISILLIADAQQFTALAASLPGSEEERHALQSGNQVTEVYPLTLFAVAGMMLFPVSSDLITLFVALEVLSLPLYLMAGLSRRRRLASQEAALKYFLLGAFSSAFFLFGAAFLYGYSSSISFSGIRSAVVGGSGNDVFLLIGISFLSVGLLFKVGAVPFHAWSPDVYQGAPTPVTAFMAAATKIAAFGAMLRIYYTVFANAQWSWSPMLIIIAIITMVFGSLVAIAQRDVKRMLAYSSIAHAGFLLTGIIALNKAGLEASLFYLFAYGITTVGAFAVVTLVRDSAGEVTDLNRWKGLGKRSPWVAIAFATFLLSFAGIPLTSGFIGKFSIFSAAYESGATSVVIAGVLSSAVAAFFYIRVIVLMFFTDPVEDGTSVEIPSSLTSITVIFSMIVTIALGVFPAPILDFISNLATFIR